MSKSLWVSKTFIMAIAVAGVTYLSPELTKWQNSSPFDRETVANVIKFLFCGVGAGATRYYFGNDPTEITVLPKQEKKS
jgi:hypothetical protein